MAPRTSSSDNSLTKFIQYDSEPYYWNEEQSYLQELNLRTEIKPDILLHACKDRHTTLAQLCELYHLFPNQVLVADNDGCNTLHWACHRNSLPLVKLILEKAPQTALIRDDSGETPLQWACRYGSLELVQYILKIVPDTATVTDNDGRLPIHWASRWDKYDIVKLLIKFAPKTTRAKDKNGWTPVHLACRWASKDTVSLLMMPISSKNDSNVNQYIVDSLDASSEILDKFMDRFNSLQI